MKKILFNSAALVLVLMCCATSPKLSAQTAGTLSYTVTTTSTGGFSPTHFLAIWIDNAANAFIKTKVAYINNGDLDHMQTWVNQTNENVVDATTGASRHSHGTVTVLWNGTNVSGTLVADGAYNIWLEMAWAASLTSGKTVNTFPFTKGPSLFQSNPANTANLLNMGITWNPIATGLEDDIMFSKDVNIYPNPSKGMLSIDFKFPGKDCMLKIVDDNGKPVYSEFIGDTNVGVRTFDLTSLPAGMYYGTLLFADRIIAFPFIIMTK